MTGPAITPEQLHYVDDDQLLALMAGTLALRVRTPEDCELLDAIGREFRSRKQPDDPDTWAICAKCNDPAFLHDPVFSLCPRDEGEAWANGEANIGPEEWARVCPHIFGDQAVA
jgi:hypothetical protein